MQTTDPLPKPSDNVGRKRIVVSGCLVRVTRIHAGDKIICIIPHRAYSFVGVYEFVDISKKVATFTVDISEGFGSYFNTIFFSISQRTTE